MGVAPVLGRAMSRVFTMRRCCKAPGCLTWFTINGSNHWFCGHSSCNSKRRKADRQAAKAQKARVAEGSSGHLERATKSGD